MRTINLHRIGIFCSLSFLLLTRFAFAHPMGNFSVNHYGKIKLGQTTVEITYLVDMAEIPTYQQMRQFAMPAKPGDPATQRYLAEQESRLKRGLAVDGDGRSIELTAVSRTITFAEGAGGLPTMKLAFVFRGEFDLPAGAHNFSYSDNNFPGRAGWKEVIVRGDGPSILASSAPSADRSKELSEYSSDMLNSPPQQLLASVTFKTTPQLAPAAQPASPVIVKTIRAGRELKKPAAVAEPIQSTSTKVPPLPSKSVGDVSSAVVAVPPAQNTPRTRFTALISTRGKLSLWFLLSAALIAAGLGALHALEPGHGKTIVAAYLVGSRGTAAHAVLLGFVVTAAHTAGVYLLGVVTLYASRYIVPEQLYPWLGAISGLSVTGLGIFMFLRHLTGETGEHSHAPGDRHLHWFLSMFQQGAFRKEAQAAQQDSLTGSNPGGTRAVSLRELCILGVTGGIVPCPAALVVLLSAFSLHRIGFGLFLITAFSLGLAAVLVVVGLTMVYAKCLMAARIPAGGAIMHYLPLVSSASMVLLGVGIAVSAFASVPIGQNLFSKEKLLPFVTVTLLGLFLGMRHSTDPDHVVAVSTIVSRLQSVRSSATIGMLWGLGHTLTIFLVGSAIIIFGVVIPPRLGLSMEFSVALMLILLGILNLTGVLQWITERFAPTAVTGKALEPKMFARSNPPEELKPAATPAETTTFLGRLTRKLGLYQTLRPLLVGLVHGLAGSAAVALLVLSTIKNPFWSTAYLLVFGLGTMAGMMFMTAAISLPLVLTGKKFSGFNRHLTVLSGLTSVAFGMFLVYQIGFVDGLFSSAHVHWVPQ
jgi:nickel/cobalt exporter